MDDNRYEEDIRAAQKEIESQNRAWNQIKEQVITEINEHIKSRLAYQEIRWGGNLGAHEPDTWLVILGKESGKACKAVLEEDTNKYKDQLIDIAAVAISALQGITLEELDERWRSDGN